MKIATKTGDNGTTSLLYGTRVPKTDQRIDIVGNIDELSAYVGLVKLEISEFLSNRSVYLSVEDCPTAYDSRDFLTEVQKLLILIMGEIVCENNKFDRYAKSFSVLNIENLNNLEKRVELFESDQTLIPSSWVIYGHNRVSVHLDICSKICRRVERALWTYIFINKVNNSELISKYINRLSDYLYLSARFFEKKYI